MLTGEHLNIVFMLTELHLLFPRIHGILPRKGCGYEESSRLD
jgi:hypothetical protein